MSDAPARELSDCSVLIAGGSSGVGLATARAFAAAGVPRIALLARNRERGEAAAAAVRNSAGDCEVVFTPADATDLAQLKEAANQVRDRFGGIDVLVNSTTTTALPTLFHDERLESVEKTLDALILPPLLLCRIVLPWMQERGGGAIINIASDAAKVPTPGEAIIGAGMAAIVMFTRTLAMEAKRNGIRANVVTPSLIAGTPTSDAVLREGFSQRLFAKAAKMAHLGVAVPEDLAALILFLASPAARRLTGQAISVNGGISAA